MRKKVVLLLVLVLGLSFAAANTPSSLLASGADATQSGENSDNNAFFNPDGVNQDNNDEATESNNPDLVYLPTGYATSMVALLTSLLSLIIAVVALIVFAYLIWGGVSWITSGGDKGKTDAARSKILAAIIGLVVVASSYAILSVLVRFLGFESLTEVFESVIPLNDTRDDIIMTETEYQYA